MNAEEQRLEEIRIRGAPWRKWGPYVSERSWGTVREDYSAHGTPWEYLPHDHARSKAYRWGEDGLAGFCDRDQFLCFALALWNGRDPILKERLFGLDGNEGNHGEDVKEYYFYLDATPTYSYAKFLYKYPQAEFPYARLVEQNRRTGRGRPEFELTDTGVFDDGRYFDVFVEYAKEDWDELLIRIAVVNIGPEPAPLDIIPTLWFRNTWGWGWDDRKPLLRAVETPYGMEAIHARHHDMGEPWLLCAGSATLLFTENETNSARLYGIPHSGWVKDGIHEYIIRGSAGAVNPARVGTKAAAHYRLMLAPRESRTLRLKLSRTEPKADSFSTFDQILAMRLKEADDFYETVHSPSLTDGERIVQRQALAGMLWSKQFYYNHVNRWLRGDLAFPRPPESRLQGRNREWTHLRNSDILSVPDKWEFPWFACWDLAFHAVTYALIDPGFAKDQLLLLLREWYMHPNGQLPACEWNFSDVNPPVHAWAALQVYRTEQRRFQRTDRRFLERVFHKLLLNFTWWVNRKDADGSNVFEGGFLGLDNIGVFDRSAMQPGFGHMEQTDATSWMGMYCLSMMEIALELARENPAYEDVASKFLEHFVYIARAMNNIAGQGIQLWDKQDGFFYDVLRMPGGKPFPLRVRSMVGLTPLFAVSILESELVDTLPGFKRRMQYFIDNLPEFSDHLETVTTATNIRRFLSLVNRDRLRRVLTVMLDEEEFLSPFGIRSLSLYHRRHPYEIRLGETNYTVRYEPGESESGMFGGNSNWRGPVWFPMNYLLMEALRRFHDFLGPGFRVHCPGPSGPLLTLEQVRLDLSRRLIRLFLPGTGGLRPANGGLPRTWHQLPLFHEYFHGETGAGLGASHQTGWTGLVANLLDQATSS